MRVERFSLFFPPTIWKVKRGETEYAIGSIPAGGYVKISGMNPDEDLPEEVRDRAYHAQPVWKRIVVIAAGPAREPRAGVRAAVRLLRGDRAAGHDAGRGPGRQELPGPGRAEARRPAGGGGRASGGAGSALEPVELPRLRRAAAGRKTAARRSTPAKLTVVRNGKRLTVTLTPEVRLPRGRAPRGGCGSASPTSRDRTCGCRPARPSRPTADRFWFITKQTLGLPARLINPAAAQADLAAWSAPTRSRARRS